MTRLKDGWRPTAEQELLLKASLLQGQGAVESWEAWKSSVDYDSSHPDQASFRLLPLLYRNLRDQDVQDSLMPKLKGIYRNTWYRNQLALRKMRAVLCSFREAGIETLVLKGAALATLYYKDYGVRPMADLDVLVPLGQASAAMELLRELGWTPKIRLTETQIAQYLLVRHSLGFSDGTGQEFDLHWHILPEWRQSGADDRFLEDAAGINIGDTPTHALNPADQLLHTCAQGTRCSLGVPRIRWVADATTVLRTAQAEIDWERLVSQAARHRLTLALRDAFDYLRYAPNVSVPQEFSERLAATSISRYEQVERRFQTGRTGLLGSLPNTWFVYLRATGHVSFLHRVAGYPKHLQHLWGIGNLWQLPLFMAHKGMQKVWMRASSR